jgi:hypothetical protein
MLALPMADDPFELSQEETQVMLGRYAGSSLRELSETTGMPVGRVQAIVTRLTALGLLGDETPEPAEAQAHHAEDDLVALLDAATFDLLPTPTSPPAEVIAVVAAAPKPAARAKVDEDEGEPGDATPAAPAPPVVEAPAPDEEDRAADEAEQTEDTREYKKLYEAELHPLPLDERVALAGTATGAKLFALCFDPVPAVIGAIFGNVAASVEHARLIAFHHRDPRGLEELAGRPQLAADPLVHRRLVRNPGTTEPMLRRLLGNKRLPDVYKISLDRDVPERSRASARNLLRSRFTQAAAEERVELVLRTEGRVLMILTGCTFDSRMTSILCGKSIASIMLIQNLARFPATPPTLLAHLLRQPLVKRQPQLRNQILQHQNTPSDAKRQR